MADSGRLLETCKVYTKFETFDAGLRTQTRVMMTSAAAIHFIERFHY